MCILKLFLKCQCNDESTDPRKRNPEMELNFRKKKEKLRNAGWIDPACHN